jgi:hypothetical protein
MSNEQKQTEGVYLVANTGSPAERAMVAAENAMRVPLNEDRDRFKVLDFVKEAIEALDEVHGSDQITPELVRSKIGKAQHRAGFQRGPGRPRLRTEQRVNMPVIGETIRIDHGDKIVERYIISVSETTVRSRSRWI